MKRVSLNGVRKLARFEVVAAAIVISLAVSCYPGEITNVAQTDLVRTLYATDAAWGSFDSVVVLDFVFHIVPEGSDTVELSRDFDRQIIDLVRDGYTGYGYNVTLADPDDVDPDNPEQSYAVIQALGSSTTVFYQWGGWWGGWGWWGGGGWPCCWGGVGSQTYYTGTIFIDMLDGRDQINDTTAKVLWDAAISGLLSGSAAGTADRINRNIPQAFQQSPYLAVVAPAPATEEAPRDQR